MTHPRDEIARALQGAKNILVATHTHPDADALGSQIALGNILASLGKKVFLYGEDEVSHLYRFLPGSDRIGTLPPNLSDFDCAVALDCGDCYRLGQAMEQLLTVRPFLVVDHHQGHADFGDLRWVAPDRAATGELVYDLAQVLGGEISRETAYCLYAAIVADTGSFKYSSTTTETFRIAGELVARGVKPADVSGKLFDNFTVQRLRLLHMVLETLQLHAEERLALIVARREFFVQTGTSQADTEGFINYPRSLTSVKVAALLKETMDGMVSVSLRSKGKDHDVAKVAAFFGGGGHRNAAGFKVAGATMEDVREKLLAKLLPLVNG